MFIIIIIISLFRVIRLIRVAILVQVMNLSGMIDRLSDDKQRAADV